MQPHHAVGERLARQEFQREVAVARRDQRDALTDHRGHGWPTLPVLKDGIPQAWPAWDVVDSSEAGCCISAETGEDEEENLRDMSPQLPPWEKTRKGGPPSIQPHCDNGQYL